jgi:hypothetical protein
MNRPHMSEHQRDMAFLRRVMAHGDTSERRQLEEEITQAERDERCVRRAVRLMAVLAALATVGLGYAAVLLADYPGNMPRFATHGLVKVSCALGLASLVSLLAFVALAAVYRKDLGKRREECRRLAAKVLEERLGRPVPGPAGQEAGPSSGEEHGSEAQVNGERPGTTG